MIRRRGSRRPAQPVKKPQSNGKPFHMVIGDRVRRLRKRKHLSQGDIEKRTGLLRSCISRLENGHAIPALHTLEKVARALEVPLFRLFTDNPRARKPRIPKAKIAKDKRDREQEPFVKALSHMGDKQIQLLFHMASLMARRH
jgi:transcriptional regulator with XRE-family HTH domain